MAQWGNNSFAHLTRNPEYLWNQVGIKRLGPEKCAYKCCAKLNLILLLCEWFYECSECYSKCEISE